MNAPESINESLIIRFLQKKATEEEINWIMQWIEKDPANLKYFHELQDLWNIIELDDTLTEDVLEDRWKELSSKISSIGIITQKDNAFQTGFKKLIRIAAIFIIGILSGVLVLKLYDYSRDKEIVYNEVKTPLGARSTLTLPDGTKIWLNAGSSVRYPSQFSNNKRVVSLEGEAYFDVTHDKKRRFIVETPGIEIRVHGTEFNVKAYPDDNVIETTLVEGSISIIQTTPDKKKKSEEIILKPNQRFVIYKKKEIEEDTVSTEKPKRNIQPIRRPNVLAKGINPLQYTSWKDGDLIIRSETMESLATKLERRYDVNIYFEDDMIKTYTYSGTISSETLEQVMAAIKIASPIDYQIDEREVRLSTKKNTD